MDLLDSVESSRKLYNISESVEVCREKRKERYKGARGDGISCSSMLDREFERKSHSRLCHGGDAINPRILP